MYKLFVFILFFCFGYGICRGEGDSSRVAKGGYFRFRYENDFFTATDRYYTQGLRAELVAPWVKKIPLSPLLISAGSNSVKQYGILAAQDCYTPSSIRRDTVFTGERPFAAAMYAGLFLISTNAEKKQRLTTELIIGAVGPCASCEQEQKSIHRWLNNIQPLGWQFQVKNDVIINYNIRYEKMMWHVPGVELFANANAAAGTFKNKAGLGGMLRTGRFDNNFALLQNSRGKGYDKKLQCYFYLWGNAQGVAYDATMQGGIFDRESIYTITAAGIERIVLSGGGGIVFTVKKFSLGYAKTWLTREFKGGLGHGWGSILITSAF